MSNILSVRLLPVRSLNEISPIHLLISIQIRKTYVFSRLLKKEKSTDRAFSFDTSYDSYLRRRNPPPRTD